MTDGEVLSILRQIDRLNDKINALVAEIEASDHPHAKEIVEMLRDNCFDNVAWAEHCFKPMSGKWRLATGGWQRLKG